jgi:NADPH:quinone reductase-like Zn-dependent oxidoreductase
MSKSKSVRGSTARIAGITDRHRCAHSRSTSALASPPGIGRHSINNMKALHELAAKGALKPRISHRFPLAQAAEAMQAVIDRKVIGKAVLVG